MSSRIGRAGLGKAVSVLDTLGSSMTNLNSGTGFNSAPPAKGNEIAIIAFEIANTVVKGYNLMQSISTRSIKNLKEVVFPSEGVQYLVSKDTEELLRIVAADKRWILNLVENTYHLLLCCKGASFTCLFCFHLRDILYETSLLI